MALKVVREREAAYVWAARVAAARRNGLRDEAIDLLRATWVGLKALWWGRVRTTNQAVDLRFLCRG
jgi:hypothetical protein